MSALSAPAGRASQRLCDLHRDALAALQRARCPFLIGGAYALARHAGLRARPVKDLDIVVRRRDLSAALEALERHGWSTEVPFPHWLAKARRDGELVDLIFASGNGEARVTDIWFEHATAGRLFGLRVAYCPPEEEIWMRSFVMERVRYDGADVAHLLRACADTLDWPRLLEHFGSHWRLLLSHLVLFGFIYPNERDRIPRWVMEDLIGRIQAECDTPPRREAVCRGTLLSRVEYQVDVGQWGYADARIEPRGRMTRDEARSWTRAGFSDAARRSIRDRPRIRRERPRW